MILSLLFSSVVSFAASTPMRVVKIVCTPITAEEIKAKYPVDYENIAKYPDQKWVPAKIEMTLTHLELLKDADSLYWFDGQAKISANKKNIHLEIAGDDGIYKNDEGLPEYVTIENWNLRNPKWGNYLAWINLGPQADIGKDSMGATAFYFYRSNTNYIAVCKESSSS